MPLPEDLPGVDLVEIRDRVMSLAYFTDAQDIQAGAQAIEGVAPFIAPAAFVTIASERYGANKLIGGHRQRATPIISVLYCIASERAADDLSDEVEQARRAVRDILKGWTPAGAEKALDATDYTVRLIADGLIWCEWKFTTTYHS